MFPPAVMGVVCGLEGVGDAQLQCFPASFQQQALAAREQQPLRKAQVTTPPSGSPAENPPDASGAYVTTSSGLPSAASVRGEHASQQLYPPVPYCNALDDPGGR